MSVTENVALPQLPVMRNGLISWKAAREQAQQYLRVLDTQYRSLTLPSSHLSGGNQQKVLLARWISKGFHTFILSEPLQGLDIRSLSSMLDILADLRDSSAAILIITASAIEFHELADTVLRVADSSSEVVDSKSPETAV
jgi:ABC-type sugar transport system ATPase subunit